MESALPEREWMIRIDSNGSPRGRGNGKTGLVAGLMLAHLLGPECEPRGECYSIEMDSSANRKPSKKRAIGHIDGVVALLMALAIAEQPQPAIDVAALIG
jgi:hypothetical protein